MAKSKNLGELYGAVASVSTLADAARAMRRLTEAIGAGHYLVLDASRRGGDADARIVLCDWQFDCVGVLGQDALAALVNALAAPRLGSAAEDFRCLAAGALRERIGADQFAFLSEAGHGAFLAARVHAGTSQGFVMFSAHSEDAIELAAMPYAQLLCSHVWSRLNRRAAPVVAEHPLSERERECLAWVSEGKTTDEVALILQVSGNTVNRYILHATRKLGTASRTRAIAVAIRMGLI